MAKTPKLWFIQCSGHGEGSRLDKGSNFMSMKTKWCPDLEPYPHENTKSEYDTFFAPKSDHNLP